MCSAMSFASAWSVSVTRTGTAMAASWSFTGLLGACSGNGRGGRRGCQQTSDDGHDSLDMWSLDAQMGHGPDGAAGIARHQDALACQSFEETRALGDLEDDEVGP